MVGWVANSNDRAGRKQPIILTWMPRTPFYGHDWLPVQDFTTEEQVLNNLKDRQAVSQVAQRIRFKMRHMDQGNILASSAQGADLFLDESVLLTNRRANEIRLKRSRPSDCDEIASAVPFDGGRESLFRDGSERCSTYPPRDDF